MSWTEELQSCVLADWMRTYPQVLSDLPQRNAEGIEAWSELV